MLSGCTPKTAISQVTLEISELCLGFFLKLRWNRPFFSRYVGNHSWQWQVAAAEDAQLATAVGETIAAVALALCDHMEDQINRTDTRAQAVLAAAALKLGWFSTQNPTAVQALLGVTRSPMCAQGF
jgi:hypothetical protein